MGCGDACPVYLGKRYLDWELPDPAGKAVAQVRVIREEIGRASRPSWPSFWAAPSSQPARPAWGMLEA